MFRIIRITFGSVLVLAGILLMASFFQGILVHQSHDEQQKKAWETFIDATSGPSKPGTVVPGGVYFKMTVPKIGKNAVGLDGDWNTLKITSLVHYHDSPAPGQKGNMLIAFHREPNWLNIDQVSVGDKIEIEDTKRQIFIYQIDKIQETSPSDVSMLAPTQDMNITMITCDPVWRDYNRLIFRGHLLKS
jgi:LPXTG-site transpeptidase (sortase) family protein